MFLAGDRCAVGIRTYNRKGRMPRPFAVYQGAFQFGTYQISHILQQLQNSLTLGIAFLSGAAVSTPELSGIVLC